MGPQTGAGRWALIAIAPVTLAVVIGLVVRAPSAQTTSPGTPATVRAPLPASLSDQDFWKFVTDHSEASGVFPRENLTSNEVWFERVIPDLLKRAKPGGVYLGVGPEQNFTYIAALKPAMAIIFDIRRGNLDVQLMYKAIFELTKDRADFMAMLFSRPRPAGLGPRSTVLDLFTAFANVHSSSALYDQNLKAIDDQLIKTHKLGAVERRHRMGPVRVPDVLSLRLRHPAVAELCRSHDGHRRG